MVVNTNKFAFNKHNLKIYTSKNETTNIITLIGNFL